MVWTHSPNCPQGWGPLVYKNKAMCEHEHTHRHTHKQCLSILATCSYSVVLTPVQIAEPEDRNVTRSSLSPARPGLTEDKAAGVNRVARSPCVRPIVRARAPPPGLQVTERVMGRNGRWKRPLSSPPPPPGLTQRPAVSSARPSIASHSPSSSNPRGQKGTNACRWSGTL